MKFIAITPFAATVVLATRTHLRDFDVSSYDNDFLGYVDRVPIERDPINSGEIYAEGEDPYTTPRYGVGHPGVAVNHGPPERYEREAPYPRREPQVHVPISRDPHGVDYHAPEPHYHEPEPHYHEPEPVYHAPEPVYHAPEPVYHEPEPHYHDSHDSHHHHHDSSSDDYEPAPRRERSHHGYEPQYYAPEDYGNVPTGDFWNQVSDFNEWNVIWDQVDYEERIQTEAELMVALEAIREALVDLDYEIDHLEDCIDDNNYKIDRNYDGIKENDRGIDYNDQEIDDQRYRLKRLQKQCRTCEARLGEDRDALVLYCQQFAWAKDMVGACADILTCAGTELPYQWTYWTHPVAYPAPDAYPPHGDYPHSHDRHH